MEAIIYSLETEGSVKIAGKRAAVMTSPADFFGRYGVTLFVNVEINEAGRMKDATCLERKTFKTEGGALRFSNRHLAGAR